MKQKESNQVAYFAFPDFVSDLVQEIKQSAQIIAQYDRLILAQPSTKTPRQPIWAQCVLENPQIIEIDSIGDASKKLKSLSKRWASYSFENHRRAELIQEQTFKYKNKPIDFLGKIPDHDWALWCLIEPNKILASTKSSSPFPFGEILFTEDKTTPPSRAYLKLWELFTAHQIRPKKNSRVIDLGSCPGGWTWVLQQVGCHVISVDKAPLDQKIAKLPNIEYLKKDAFALKPTDIGKIDWLFSDIICYPQKLYELVIQWIESGLCENFVCTIKFQGQTDWETMNKFLKIPNSRILHLCHNKHEVTWVRAATR